MTEAEASAIFLLAGITVSASFQIENDYWPKAYVEARQQSPWWLLKTEYGLIRIGWRKRVISIDWKDTAVRQEITEDDTTKGPAYVHAWSYSKAVEYMAAWKRAAKATE
jgi:hypothetical protein